VESPRVEPRAARRIELGRILTKCLVIRSSCEHLSHVGQDRSGEVNLREAARVLRYLPALIFHTTCAHSNTSSPCPSLRLLPDTAICVLEILLGRVFPTQASHAAWFDRCARGAQVDPATLLPDAGIAARILRVPRGHQSVCGADKLPNPSVTYVIFAGWDRHACGSFPGNLKYVIVFRSCGQGPKPVAP
jgi:hypothetical protein